MRFAASILTAWLALASISSAAISYIGINSPAASQSNYNLAWGTMSAAGRIAFVVQISKPYDQGATNVPGFTSLVDYANGTSPASSADAGSMRVQIFYKLLDGTETGNLSVTSVANSMQASLIVYANGTGLWDVAGTSGNAASNTATGSDALAFATGDWLLHGFGSPADAFGVASACAASATGVTFSADNVLRATSATTGFDCSCLFSDHPISSASTTVAPTLSWTGESPSGTSGFVRIREASSGSVKISPAILNQLIQ